jgi:hypothetical protein
MTPELASEKLKSVAVFLLRQRPGWKGDFTGDYYALAIVRMIEDEKVQAAAAWLLAQGPKRGFDGADATLFLLHLTARAFGEERSLWTPIEVDAQRTKMLEAAELAYAEAAAAEFEGDEAKARDLCEEAAYIESLAQELGVNDPTVAPYGKDLSPIQALARGMALIVAAALKKEFGREFTPRRRRLCHRGCRRAGHPRHGQAPVRLRAEMVAFVRTSGDADYPQARRSLTGKAESAAAMLCGMMRPIGSGSRQGQAAVSRKCETAALAGRLQPWRTTDVSEMVVLTARVRVGQELEKAPLAKGARGIGAHTGSRTPHPRPVI